MKYVIETSEMNEICHWNKWNEWNLSLKRVKLVIEISELVNPFFEMSEICYWKRVKWVKRDETTFWN